MLKILFLLLTCHCLAEEALTVHLSTENQLAPLYLCPFREEQSGLSPEYVKQLQQILAFDLNYNGATLVLPPTPERKAFVDQEVKKEELHYAAWKSQHIAYLVQPKIHEKQLSAQVTSILNPRTTPIRGLVLTGKLSEDRRKIHQLADIIHKVFFGVEGIASTKFLYTVKIKSQDTTYKKQIAEVWEADYDGGNARQVTHEGHLCVTPTYLPPKPGYTPAHFFYISYRLGQPKIYFASLKKGDGEPILSLRGNQFMPMTTRTGDNLTFVCDIAGNPDLFLQAFDRENGPLGKPRQIFTAPRGTQASPTFSPDGKNIAFVSNKDGPPRIYTMPIPPSGMDIKHIQTRLISKQNKENTSPAWSPDGTKIAYSAMTDGIRQIWYYDFTTDKEVQLTTGPGLKENPTWAPDSLHLIFNSGDLNHGELYLVNLHQPEAIKISSGPGEKRFPCWQPVVPK